ncbi:MAG: OmpA family protein [Thiolinea sp.]
MSKQRSWCCGYIPGFWWWFLALIGLPLLFLLMTYFRQGVVESDLTNRVSQALTEANIDWVNVDVEHRGRDVLLTGAPPAAGDEAEALKIAAAVAGVNKVDFAGLGDDVTMTTENAATEPAIILPTLNATLRDGKMILQGSLPSQQEVEGLVNAAEKRFGKDNVSNQLIVGEGVATPEWLASADELLSIVPDKDAALNISDQGVEIAGEVKSDDVKQAMLLRAKRLLGDQVTDNISVKRLLPPEVEMQLADGKFVLNGKVSSQEQADDLFTAAAKRVGIDNVDNKLEVSEEYADAGWLDSAQKIAETLLAENGTAKIAEGTLELEAAVDSEATRNALVAKSNEALKDSGLILVNNISVSDEASGNAADNQTTDATQGAADDQTTDATQEATDNTKPDDADEQKAEAAAKVCQEKLDSAMKDKNILFRVNKADIRNESNALLDELAGIVQDCKNTLSGKQVAIGGHTDSDGAKSYNLQLSQRRADAVRAYLIGKGVSGRLLTAKGFGEAEPVASNSTAAGKAQNRRISFDIKIAE